MSVSEQEREHLHTILDALLDARIALEEIDPKELRGEQYYRNWSGPRADLFREGSLLLRRILGTRLHGEEMKLLFNAELKEDAADTEVLATLANSLRSFLPLFKPSGVCEADLWRSEIKEPIDCILEDLMGIHWGDEPRFFSVMPKRQGLHKRPYRLARLRLAALDWDKYLAAVGVAAHERHSKIAAAFRTDWEAIRKWPASIEELCDFQSFPPSDVEWAKHQFANNPEEVWAAIERVGNRYWEEKRTAQSGRNRRNFSGED